MTGHTSSEKELKILVRRAAENDVEAIKDLLNHYAKDGIVLPRTSDNIRHSLQNFYVVELNDEFVGCAALRDFGNSLYEVRSLAITPGKIRSGAGTALINHIIKKFTDAAAPARLFALTYKVAFFKKFGFKVVDKSMFPEKIWTDCAICKKRDHCDETAVIMEFK